MPLARTAPVESPEAVVLSVSLEPQVKVPVWLHSPAVIVVLRSGSVPAMAGQAPAVAVRVVPMRLELEELWSHQRVAIPLSVLKALALSTSAEFELAASQGPAPPPLEAPGRLFPLPPPTKLVLAAPGQPGREGIQLVRAGRLRAAWARTLVPPLSAARH
jgi:hypothetical protein